MAITGIKDAHWMKRRRGAQARIRVQHLNYTREVGARGLVSVAEAARVLGTNRMRIYRLAAQKKLEIRAGRIRVADLIRVKSLIAA